MLNLYYDQQSKENHGFRAGAGSNFARYLREITAGVGLYYLLGRQNNFFETGLDIGYLHIEANSDDQKGFALIYPDKNLSSFYSTINIGYRHIGRKLIFRLGFAPGITKNQFIPGGYISLGRVL